jgi:hypothetical protein
MTRDSGTANLYGIRGRDDFEQNDLMRSRDRWPMGGEFENNYWALKQDLDIALPALP